MRGATRLGAFGGVALALSLTACSVSSPLEAPSDVPPRAAEASPEPVEEPAGPRVAPAPPATPSHPAARATDERQVSPAPASREALVAEAQAMLAGALDEAPAAQLGVLVVDEYGRTVLAHDADEALLPASTLKIVTAAAALTTFGPEATFRTTVETTGPIDAGGTLRGDLVLVGSGDPVLATAEYARWVYPARPRTPLEELADAVVAAGVRRVAGDVVGVAHGFDGPSVADGWPDRYFSAFDARYADGLSVDAGLRTILTYPDVEDPDAEEPGTGAATRTEVAEPATQAGPAVAPTVRIDHALEPARQAASELRRLLEDRGVPTEGGIATGPPAEDPIGHLAAVTSPPMHHLLRFAVQRSDNQLTDGIFRALGRARTGVGSFAAGDRAVRQALDHLGVDHRGAHFADGSGLSRADRSSARLLVDVDRAMAGSRHAATWSSLMAVTGRSGTLESRLRRTAADGRFWGKTGTLQDVGALVGAVHGPGGRRYHLAVIANDPGGGRWVARVLADELILLLTADLDGCAPGAGTGGDNALGRPSFQRRC